MKTTLNPMKTHNKFSRSLMIVCLSFAAASTAIADTIVLSNDQPIGGKIIQTNGDDVLILTSVEAFNYSHARIKQIETEPVNVAEPSSISRLPDFQTAVSFLSKQPWATNLTPIPSTVIDNGILKNVPYSSFHCGADYEVNIYGDLQNPAGIEIGIYRKLPANDSAKDNCFNFISSILEQPEDRQVVRSLNRTKDSKTRNELTFEITPSTAPDSYGGWWVSVYLENQLNQDRASDTDMQQITMRQADIAKDAAQSTNYDSWSADDLKFARHSRPTIITFTDSSGTIISNATVVRINDGVSLVWEKDRGSSAGLVRLEDLSDNLRSEFGYDEAKSKAADEAARENKAEWDAEVQAARSAAASQADYSSYDGSVYDGGGNSGAGTVYVHGYTRSNGTYVNSYYRRYPSR